MIKSCPKFILSLLVIWVAFSFSYSAHAALDSKGTEFVLSFPKNYSKSGKRSLFISSEIASSGTVSISGLNYSVPFSVAENSVVRIDLPLGVESMPVNTVSSLAVRVVADNEVTIYGLNQRRASTDAYLGLPIDVLGLEYLVSSYTPSLSSSPSQIVVVGVYDNTAVTITPKASAGPHSAGQPFTVNLNKNQTYYLESSGDLTGSYIKSNTPVGVFSGVKCTNIPVNKSACDHIEEMIPPVATWGKSFITVPLATRTRGDIFRILASEDNTEILIDGVNVITLNKGEFLETTLTKSSIITSSSPTLLTQFSASSSFDGVTSDPFMMLVPPSEQFLSKYSFTTLGQDVGFVNSFVNVVIPTESINSLELNKSVVDPTLFSPIGQSGFSGAQILIPAGSHTIAADVPFGIYVYGFGSYDSYGYTGGMAFEFINPKGDAFAPNVKLSQLGEYAQGIAGDSEDLNLNGLLDSGEDLNNDGVIGRRNEDVNGNDVLDDGEDLNQDGLIDVDTGIFNISLSGASANLRVETDSFVPGALSVNFRIYLIDTSAPGVGTLIVSDGAGNAVEKEISLSNMPIMTKVKVISTISSIDIDLDKTSFMKAPDKVDVLAESTVVEWNFASFSVAQNENLDYELVFKNPIPDETRLVTHKLELEYTNFDGTLIRKVLGEQNVNVARSTFDLDAVTDKPIYISGENVLIDGSVLNLSNFAADATVKLYIKDAQGNLVTSFSEITVSQVAEGISLPIDTNIFSTADIFVGEYTLVAVLTDAISGAPVEVTQVFTVTTENGSLANVQSSVTTDKASYAPWDLVSLDTLAENIADRSMVEGAKGYLKVLAPDNSVLIEKEVSLNTLSAKLQLTNQFTNQLSDALVGNYGVVWEVRNTSNEVLSAAASSFTVTSELKDVLLANVKVDSEAVYYSQANMCHFDYVNRSSVATGNVAMKYQLIRMADEVIISDTTVDADIAAKTTQNFELAIDTKINSGSYACIAQAKFDDKWETLAADTFELNIDVAIVETLGKVLVLQDVSTDDNTADPFGPIAAKLASQNTVLTALLESEYFGYKFTDNVNDFVTELNSGQYDAYLVLPELFELTSEAKMLLKYSVFVGDGLYVSNKSLVNAPELEKALGIELAQKQPVVKSLILNDVLLPLATQQPFAFTDSAYSFHPVTASLIGTYEQVNDTEQWQYDDGIQCVVTNEPPAMSLNTYGNGTSVYSGFDLMAQANTTTSYFSELLTGVIKLVHQDVRVADVYKVTSLTVTVESDNSPIPGRLLLTLPSGLELIDGGTFVTAESETEWLFDLAADSSLQTTIQVMGTVAGNYELEVALESGITPNYQAQQVNVIGLSIIADDNSIAKATSLVQAELQLNPRNARLKFALRALNKAEQMQVSGAIDDAVKQLDIAINHLEYVDLDTAEIMQVLMKLRLNLVQL